VEIILKRWPELVSNELNPSGSLFKAASNVCRLSKDPPTPHEDIKRNADKKDNFFIRRPSEFAQGYFHLRHLNRQPEAGFRFPLSDHFLHPDRQLHHFQGSHLGRLDLRRLTEC
jgi:hypothetical protein